MMKMSSVKTGLVVVLLSFGSQGTYGSMDSKKQMPIGFDEIEPKFSVQSKMFVCRTFPNCENQKYLLPQKPTPKSGDGEQKKNKKSVS